jgi:hypothetical protein
VSVFFLEKQIPETEAMPDMGAEVVELAPR